MSNRHIRLGVLLLGVAASAQERDPQGAEPMLRIRGRVLDAAGQPLAKAGVVVGPEDKITTADAIVHPQGGCAADGSFAIEVAGRHLDWCTPSVLLVVAPRKVAFCYPLLPLACRRLLGRDESNLDLGEIRLPDCVTYSGRVRGRAGKPIAGAIIRARDSLCLAAASPAYCSPATTGADGTFVLAGVFANAMQLTVEADGYYTTSLPAVNLGDPLDLQLEESGLVEGTIEDDEGRPFEGPVWATHEFTGGDLITRNAAHGKFRLGVSKRCRFKVVAMDRATGRFAESRLLDGPASGVLVRFDASAEKWFVVRGVDKETGKPIAPIRASVDWFFGGKLSESLENKLAWNARRSDADGRVWLEPPRQEETGKGVLSVIGEGHAPLFVENIEWKRGEEFVAQLVPESRIEGRVVDVATGKPAAGMEVTCERPGKQVDRFGQRMRPVPIITAADGAFTIRGLAHGDYELAARRPVGTAMVSKRVSLKAGEVCKDLEVVLPAGVTVSGTVTGAKPSPGWKMLLARPDVPPAEDPVSAGRGSLESWNFEGAVPLTDGSFRFEHRAPGTEQLFLFVPIPPRHGAALRIPVVTVAIGKTDLVVDADLSDHLPGAVEGKIHRIGADIPLARLAVVTTALAEEQGGWTGFRDWSLRRHWATVEPDGAFAMPAAPGKYRLDVVDVATGVTLKAGDSVEVVAGKPTRTDLRVDLVEAIVRLEPEGEGRSRAERLVIHVVEGRTKTWEDVITLFAGLHGTPGVELAGLLGEVRILVPPGIVKLQLYVGAKSISRDRVVYGEPQADTLYEAEYGKVGMVTMKVPPPADLDGK